MKYIVFTLMLMFTNVYADTTDYKVEPQISIYQGSERGTSVVVVRWPDGVVDRLLYKNDEVAKGATGYLKWFNERMEAYEQRTRR